MTPARAVATLAGAVLVGVGLSAFIAPRPFYDAVATFPPYNEHFLRDVGAFNVGLGAVLLLAVRWTDALFVVLAGNAVGAALHAGSHVVDADVSGPATPILTVLFAVVLALAAAWRRREGAG